MPTEPDTAPSRGWVFDIQRGSMVDGPGLRTAVFLKGCPLQCSWCHNPEAIDPEPQTVRTENGQLKTYGQQMTLEEVWEPIEKDRPFYSASGGGLTISGGEPMLQFAFTLALARKAHAAGIQVAVDSTGFGNRRQWQEILPYVHLFLFDYKLTDPEQHRELTGQHPGPLHRNILQLAEQGARIRLRCPIIPGINDTPEHFAGIRAFAAQIPHLEEVELMPYHDTARYKYDQLGLPYSITSHTPEEAEIERWHSWLA